MMDWMNIFSICIMNLVTKIQESGNFEKYDVVFLGSCAVSFLMIGIMIDNTSIFYYIAG